MSNLYKESIYIYAAPSATNVEPYNILVQPISLSGSQTTTINLIGRSFWNIENVYLSASDISIFQNQGSFFNPFSTSNILYPSNKGFYGIVIPYFNIINENNIVFDIPNYIFNYIGNLPTRYSVFLDIIVENEAGYSLLSRDSIAYPVSSWTGFKYNQLPCISGIKITNY